MKAESSLLSLEQEMLRAARNQALYRQVNEKIQQLNRAFDAVASISGTWVCECADPDCTEMMEMTLAEYESVRADPNRFALLRGHELPEVERIVEEHEKWVVVEKLGAAAAFVVEHDPRAPSQTA